MTHLALPARQYHSIDTFNAGPLAVAYTIATAITLPANDTVVYVPITVSFTVVALKLWICSGSTATGNFDLGLYSQDGTRLVSKGGTNAKPGTDEAVLDVTDTTITPGLYYMAMVGSNTTDTWGGYAPAAPHCAGAGVLTESAGSTAVPATASWAISQVLTVYPLMGLLASTVVA